jgi:twitching motility protein PilT
MAQLDKFIKAMLDNAGSSFCVRADAEPHLRVGGATRSLLSRTLTGDQVRYLLDEILPPGLTRTLTDRDGGEFTYAPPGLESVTVQVRAWGGAVEAVFDRDGATADDDSIPLARPRASPYEAKPGGMPSPIAEGDLPPATAHAVDPAAAGKLRNLLSFMVKMRGSDLHISCSEKPIVRVDGDLQRLDQLPVLDDATIRQMVYAVMPPRSRAQFDESKDADFAYEIKGLSRFRGNVFMDRKGIGAVFRTIPSEIPTTESMGLSAAIQNLCFLHKGLVLVTGPTGSGKTTTLCALLDLVNRKRRDHIITIEDPIEYVHPNKGCLINQREVGEHTESFKRALRAALREDPDVVLVGEMRDLETIAIAIETAETGHLVFGTLHTTTAASTVDRIIDQFPADRQAQIRVMLSESLKAVISQTLCKKIGGGRVAAREVLLVNAAVSNLIREGKSFQIASIMQTQRKAGMVTLNDALLDLVLAKKVEPKDAYIKADDKAGFATAARQANIPLDFLATDPTAQIVGTAPAGR